MRRNFSSLIGGHGPRGIFSLLSPPGMNKYSILFIYLLLNRTLSTETGIQNGEKTKTEKK